MLRGVVRSRAALHLEVLRGAPSAPRAAAVTATTAETDEGGPLAHGRGRSRLATAQSGCQRVSRRLARPRLLLGSKIPSRWLNPLASCRRSRAVLAASFCSPGQARTGTIVCTGWTWRTTAMAQPQAYCSLWLCN